MNLKLEDKIKGCLFGTMLGTELGYRTGRGNWSPGISNVDEMEKALSSEPCWLPAPQLLEKNVWDTSLAFLPASVARTYIKKQGRITPEDWASELKSNPGIPEGKPFWLLDIYTTIELLNEGMNPRLSGLNAVPSSHMCVGIIPAGIYHAGDPYAAYLDAVEIASVTQRTPAVEWAALTAAAVSEALKPNATPGSVLEMVLNIAKEYCSNIHDEILAAMNSANKLTQDEFLKYFANMNRDEQFKNYNCTNPLPLAFTLISIFDNNAEKIIKISNLGSFPYIRTSIAGALAGALNGTNVFPGVWIDGASSYVKPLLDITEVTKLKISKEKIVIHELEKLKEPINNTHSLLFDKIYGCLLAGAIGNAMGSPVECQHYLDIERTYPEGVTTILNPACLESEDDNQMAAMLTKTYIRRNGIPATARDFAETWKVFYEDKFFHCMKNAYNLIISGADPRIIGHWSLVTGSTVMCMEPVGIYHLCEPENAFIDATSISYMYQRGLDVVAASILAASVAEAFRPQATVDSILQAALDAAPRQKMNTFDKREIDTLYDFISRCLDIAAKYNDVLAVRKELYEKCLYYHMIDPLELLGLSYVMFKISKGDVRLSAIGGTNIGRDSDTISGRAAMLSGTLRGSGNIPREWVEMVNPKSLDSIKTTAHSLEDLIFNKKLVNMKARQWLLD